MSTIELEPAVDPSASEKLVADAEAPKSRRIRKPWQTASMIIAILMLLVVAALIVVVPFLPGFHPLRARPL